jgi:RNA polymerase sigma factor (sigma-70 family)
MSFERKFPHELDHLSDEELIAYAVAAREAGDEDAMQNALAVIANRRLDDLTRRAKLKVPAVEAEDIAMQALADAVLARFEGTSVGEFVKLTHTILSRRIADFYDKKGRSPDTVPLPEENRDQDESHGGRDAAVMADPAGAVEVQSAVDQARAELDERHRRVVDLYVFEDRGAQEVADQVNFEFPDHNPEMTVDNVQQIASRFRKRLRELLEDDGV